MGQAPQTFTVARLLERSAEPWGDNNDMLTTKVAFNDDPSKEWKIHHNVGWPVTIEDGAELEGWKNFEKGTFGLASKHKGDAAAKPRSGSRSSSQSSGPGLEWRSAPYERGAEHPRNEARAIHTSALSAAPAYYELLRTEGVIPQAQDKPSALNTLAGIVRWLESGYAPVLAAVSGPAQASPQNGAARGSQPTLPEEVPADREGLTPAPAGVDDSVPF